MHKSYSLEAQVLQLEYEAWRKAKSGQVTLSGHLFYETQSATDTIVQFQKMLNTLYLVNEPGGRGLGYIIIERGTRWLFLI